MTQQMETKKDKIMYRRRCSDDIRTSRIGGGVLFITLTAVTLGTFACGEMSKSDGPANSENGQNTSSARDRVTDAQMDQADTHPDITTFALILCLAARGAIVFLFL